MRTIFAARVSAPYPGKRADAQRVIEQWLEERFPYEERAAGTAVRVVDEDAWFRVSIDQHLDDELSIQTQVALRAGAPVAGRLVGGSTGPTRSTAGGVIGTLAFEARQTVVPRRVKVVRRSMPTASAAVRRLVQSVVDLIGAVDAGVPITSSARVIDTEMDAFGVAALCDAPSRSLPVVIETSTPSGDAVFGAGVAAAPLAGLAHVVVFADDRARRAFNDGWGADLLAASSLTIVWPDRSAEATPRDQRFTAQGARRELIGRIERITEVAAESLPVLPRPRPAVHRPPVTVSSMHDAAAVDESDADDADRTVTMGELLGVLDELEQAWDRVDDLQSALATADAMLADATTRHAALESRVDDLVSAKVDLEIRLGRKPDALKAANALDALEQARLACQNLDFAGDYSSLGDLTGIDPTALLIDLVTLDSVAMQWRAGSLTDITFALACRNVGLDYAADISDTARQEYADDYAVTWHGDVVLATGHVRRGRGVHLYRIHLYLDRARRRVVVGHIGRHLRGKRD